jgi:hypothetical protein
MIVPSFRSFSGYGGHLGGDAEPRSCVDAVEDRGKLSGHSKHGEQMRFSAQWAELWRQSACPI